MAKKPAKDAKYLIADEVASLYRTSRWQVYEWARQGIIPSECVIRLGRKILFDAEALRGILRGGARESRADS